jgi:pilus assembly protein TadC
LQLICMEMRLIKYTGKILYIMWSLQFFYFDLLCIVKFVLKLLLLLVLF